MLHSTAPRFGAAYQLTGENANKEGSAQNFAESLGPSASYALSHDTGTYIVVDGDEHGTLSSLHDNLSVADDRKLKETNEVLLRARDFLHTTAGNLASSVVDKLFPGAFRTLGVDAERIKISLEGVETAVTDFNDTASEKLKEYQARVEAFANSATRQEAPGPGRVKTMGATGHRVSLNG